MTVVANSAPSTNGSWWRGRGFLLVAGALVLSAVVGILMPDAVNREAVYPITSFAIAATSMALAVTVAAGVGVMRRRRR